MTQHPEPQPTSRTLALRGVMVAIEGKTLLKKKWELVIFISVDSSS